MKINLRSRNQGGLLIITVCVAFIIAAGLASYLLLVNSKHRLVSRSLYWNMAMAHAEAGVEEAFAQLNYKLGTNGLDRAANGWGFSAGVYGPVTRKLRTGAYRATISTDLLPVVTSTGYATNPISGDVVARTVQITSTTLSAFQIGMAAKLDISFKGNNVHIDSFDSSDPNKSTGGMYDATKAQANGDIASTTGFVSVQNANVNGRVLTGPGGNFSVGSSGYIGPIGFTGPGLYSPDWHRDDFNFDFKDVSPPDMPSPFNPGDGKSDYYTGGYVTYKGDTNNWVLTAGDYQVNGAVTLNNKVVLITGGHVRLYVTGDFLMSGGGSELKINPGASVTLYVGTESTATKDLVSATLSYVNTLSPNAGSFEYYGLPSNNALTWGGNASFVGTVYAPEAVFTMGGGGSTDYDYQGACVVYEAVLNGHFNFHYDENLRKKGPQSGYVPGSWAEL